LLLVASLALAACGSDKKDKGSKAADLKQTFESTTGISVKYPDGWVAQDAENGEVYIANSQDTLTAIKSTDTEELAKGQVAMLLSIIPAEALGDKSLKDAITMSASEEGKSEEVKEVKLGGKEAYRTEMSSDKLEGFTIGFEAEGAIVIAVGATAKGELKNQEEATLLKILESVTYKAPAS